jgi:hypothetical protein
MQGLEYSKYYSTFILVHAAYTSIVSMCVPMCSSFRITFNLDLCKLLPCGWMRLRLRLQLRRDFVQKLLVLDPSQRMDATCHDLPCVLTFVNSVDVEFAIAKSNRSSSFRTGALAMRFESPLHDTVPLFSYTCRCDYWIYWCNRLRYQDISGIRTYSWEWFMSFYVVWISETFWSTVSTDANEVT